MQYEDFKADYSFWRVRGSLRGVSTRWCACLLGHYEVIDGAADECSSIDMPATVSASADCRETGGRI
jgi:hypothetical protein